MQKQFFRHQVKWNSVLLAFVVAFSFFSPVSVAQTKIVVIPMSAEDLKPLKNIITVAKENGDFDDPVEAVNSISGATAANPYLVVIAPGTYTLSESLVMQPFVNITGSGVGVTMLKGSIGHIEYASASIVRAASDATLSNLTVMNTGDGPPAVYSVGIYAKDLNAGSRLSNLMVKASGSTYTYGIVSEGSESTIQDTYVQAYKVGNYVQHPIGMLIIPSDTRNKSPKIIRMYIEGTWTYTTSGYGIRSSVSSLSIRQSEVKGGLYSSGTAYISQSSVSSVAGTGTKKCAASDNGAGVELGADCLLP